MRQILAIIAAAVVATISTGCASSSEAGPDEAATALITRLRETAESGRFYYAHQDDLVYGKHWKVEDIQGDKIDRSDIKAVCGDFPAIVGYDLGGIELGSAANLDGVSFDLMRRSALEHIARGGMVTFSWHPRNPLTGGDAWDISSDQVVASILEGGEKHELFLQWLDRAADFLLTLKDADGKAVPFILRPWHENIGSWFWWGGKLCTADQYKALFRMTRDHMVSRGLRNIVWAYSPNSGISTEEYMSRYPGDECVDILGTDHYEYVGEGGIEAANVSYQEILRRELDNISKIAAEKGKVMVLSETGFESIPDGQWWTGVLLPALQGYPVAYVLTWRNAWDRPEHYYAPFPGSPDAEDFKAFYDNQSTLFLND